MNNKRTNILNDEVVISLDNIVRLSKILALSSLRNFEKYAYSNAKRIEILRKQLQEDIRYHNELDIYSDAYDLVQEASLFLLKFVGQRLGNTCTFIKPTAKAPQTISIRMACFKTLFAYLRKEMKNGNSENEGLLEFIPAENTFEKEKPDYTKINEIIKKIVTNKLEKQILIEKFKHTLKLSKEDIKQYYIQGLQHEPKLLIDYLIQEIKVFEDKIEITFNSPIKISPDKNQGFFVAEFTSKLPQYIQNKIIPNFKEVEVKIYV